MNADSHLRALLLGHNLTLQVSGGEVVLGQWQRILMAELDGPRARSLRIQIFGVSLKSGHWAMRLAVLASRRAGLARHRRQARRRRAPRSRATASGCSRRPDLLAVGWLANRERERRHGGADLLQLQHPARGDQRLRRELPVLRVRAAEAGRSRRLHDVARARPGTSCASAATSRSPRSTSSTACIPICRSTTTRSCCAASSASAPTST